MAESMAPTHHPDDHFLIAYKAWGEGGWGMILTGMQKLSYRIDISSADFYVGNVQVSETFLGAPRDIQSSLSNPSRDIKKAWKAWAAATQAGETPGIVQLNHPGRQSPLGAGNRGFFTKTVAPSPVKMNLGNGLLSGALVSLIFGTPREMTLEDISLVMHQFVAGAKQCFEAGFNGIELHGA